MLNTFTHRFFSVEINWSRFFGIFYGQTGYPSELFYRGVGMWETIYGLASAYPIVCFIFVPIYLNLGITSVYQYLDMRFKSKLVRRLASGTFIARNVFIMGITMYTPCVALNTVANIPYWASYLLMTALGILFTIFGNLKSAITADVIQGFVYLLIIYFYIQWLQFFVWWPTTDQTTFYLIEFTE